jgi:tRNA nucleotidyltransferase (CCA-adding enzyme)
MDEILKKELNKIKFSKEEGREIRKEAENFCKKIEKKLKKNKIKGEVFLGGSLAKNTMLKKERQDIDIFVRFNKKYGDEEISDLLEKVLPKSRRVHGSRDYFQIRKKKLIFEVVPVIRVSKPEKARNVTDLSYFHVDYVKKNTDEKLCDEILLSKHSCYFQDCYGAESYINGFSGYALELLTIYFGSFLKFLRGIQKERIVIDPKNHYKNKKDILNNLNEAKLQSPIIFIDPTYKRRNALAALSNETFEKFKKRGKEFLKNPSGKFFEKDRIIKKDFNLILKVKTSKQRGDVAGSKLFKFYNLVSRWLDMYFDIKKKRFFYNNKKEGRFYFNVDKKERVLEGPLLKEEKHVKKFKRKHKNTLTKKGRVYAREKPVSVKKFLKLFRKKNRKKIKEMDITSLRKV